MSDEKFFNKELLKALTIHTALRDALVYDIRENLTLYMSESEYDKIREFTIDLPDSMELENLAREIFIETFKDSTKELLRLIDEISLGKPSLDEGETIKIVDRDEDEDNNSPFRFVHRSEEDWVYTAVRQDDKYLISWENPDGSTGHTVYAVEIADNFLRDGTWKKI